MGNEQSDQSEENAFQVIKQIPIANSPNAPIRSAVYAGKGDTQKARTTFYETAKSYSFIKHKRNFFPLSHFQNDLNQGDIIEFDRGWYSHYALYIGSGMVMNIRVESKKSKQSLTFPAKLEDICKNSWVRIRNHDKVAEKWFGLKPKSTTEILFAAHCYANTTVPYEFNFRNCEYYCTFWRFGKGFSTQVSDLTTTPGGEIFLTLCHAPVAGFTNLIGYVTEATVMAKYMAFHEPVCQ